MEDSVARERQGKIKMARKKFYCLKCQKDHFVTAKIGRAHKQYAEQAKKTRPKLKKPSLPQLPDIKNVKVKETGFSFFSGLIILLLVVFFALLGLFCYQQITFEEFAKQESLTSQIRKRIADSKYATTRWQSEAILPLEGEEIRLADDAWTVDNQFYYAKKENDQEKTYLYDLTTSQNNETAWPEGGLITREEKDGLITTRLVAPEGNKVMTVEQTLANAEENIIQTQIKVNDLAEQTEEIVFSSQGKKDEQPELINVSATWSPDGQYLIYSYNQQLWLSRADGQKQRVLSITDKNYQSLHWSPDGNSLIYLSDNKIYLVTLSVRNILSKTVAKKTA